MESDIENIPEEECRTDFYVVINYKKMRGVRVLRMEDADGDVNNCIVVPMLKNGIKNFGHGKMRVILAARKSHLDENASHVLIPQVEDAVQRAMVAVGYFGRYEYTAPIVGDVVPDITKIPNPPVFSENSTSYTDMKKNETNNPCRGLTTQRMVDESIRRKNLTDTQQRMREIILKRAKENG